MSQEKNGCWLWEMKETNIVCEQKADFLNVTITSGLKSSREIWKNIA